jgi:hypothetical protein
MVGRLHARRRRDSGPSVVSSDQFHTRAVRTFIAFCFESLAISPSVCFHDASNASTEEVHMKIDTTNCSKSMLCALNAAGNPALLG